MNSIPSQLALLGLLASGSTGSLDQKQLKSLVECLDDLFNQLQLADDPAVLIKTQSERLVSATDEEAETMIGEAVEGVADGVDTEGLEAILAALTDLAGEDEDGFIETLDTVWFDHE